jgi:diacylglycerol kinase family enzyme
MFSILIPFFFACPLSPLFGGPFLLLLYVKHTLHFLEIIVKYILLKRGMFMSKVYAIYNPCANSNNGKTVVKKIEDYFSNVYYVDITTINYLEFFENIEKDDNIIICGGDGTLNRFINDTKDIKYENNILLFPIGTGNDFYREMKNKASGEPINITKEIQNLPKCIVNNNEYKFINGVGYGIDGYCCEIGDIKREKSSKPVNYTAIAVKGCLFSYRPTKCKVIVDGKEYRFKNVWLACTMKGKHYGGGMIPTPEQDRYDKEGNVSVCVFRGSIRLKVLILFASIFKGEHIKHTKNVITFKGKNIKIEYDKPRTLQIDGETVLNVNEYKVEV